MTLSADPVRFDWGRPAIVSLYETTDVFIIIDVFSFSTCVDIALGRGATVVPHEWTAGSPERSLAYPSLSPTSVTRIASGTRLNLPSRNGAVLSLATRGTPTLAACLRNARAVASRASELGRRISVIAAGERWPDGTIRFAVEDLIGAGAVIAELRGAKSAEAEIALRVFESAAARLRDVLSQSHSGRELSNRGFEDDIALAAELNCSDTAPLLRDGAYRR